MPTGTPDAAPPVVMGSRRAKPAFVAAGYRGHVSRALTATATIVVGVAFLHLAVLWGFEQQSIPQWRVMALGSTAEALPWLLLALALFHTALYARESTSLLMYRLLGLCLILLALAAAGIGVLLLAEYGSLPQDMEPQAARLLRATAFRAAGICALHVVALAPIGALGLRRPSAR